MADHIEFTPTPRDVAAAAVAMRPRNWGRHERLRLVLAGAVIVLLVYFLFAAYAWRQHGVFLLGWEDSLAFAFAGALLGWLYGRLLAGCSEDDPRLMERSFTLGKEGFATEGTGFATKVDWTAVAEIADRGETILFVTEWKEAFFIPRRAFATPAEAEAFDRRARDLWSARWDEFTLGPGEPLSAPRRYELAYQLARADLAAFAALRRAAIGWRKALIFLPAILVGGGLGWLREDNPEVAAFVDNHGGGAIAIVLALVGLGYLVFILARRLLRAWRVRRAVLPSGETRLNAGKDAVEVAFDGATERHVWKDIPAVTLGPGHVFLATAPDRAIIVPRRAFRNHAAMVEFFNFADEASSHAET